MGQQTLTTMMSMLQSEIATVQQISQTLGSGIEGYWSSGLEGGSFSAYFSGAGGKKGGASGGGGVSIGGGGRGSLDKNGDGHVSYSEKGGGNATSGFLQDVGSVPWQDYDDGKMDISGWLDEDVDYSEAYHQLESEGAPDSLLQ